MFTLHFVVCWNMQEELRPDDVVSPRLLKKKKPKEVSTPTYSMWCIWVKYMYSLPACSVAQLTTLCQIHLYKWQPLTNRFHSPLQIARQILEAHASMLSLTVADAKLQYIRNWQALQDFGITYFVVKVGRSKKEVNWKQVFFLLFAWTINTLQWWTCVWIFCDSSRQS